MSSDKKRQKELKRLDSFQQQALAALDWCLARKNQLFMALIPVLLVAAGVFAWKYVAQKQSEDRREKLASIDMIFMDEAEAVIKLQEAVQKQLDEINKKLNPVDPQAAAVANKQQLEDEKLALEKKFKELKPNHSEARDKYLNFYKEYQKYPEGWRAGLNAAGIYMEAEDHKQAAALMKEILPHAGQTHFYDIQARALYVSLLEELGEYESALSEVDKLLGSKEEELIPRFLLMKGRLQLLHGQKDQAKETFSKIVTEHNTSAEAHKAKAYNILW